MVVLGNVRLSVRIESWFKSDFFFSFFFYLNRKMVLFGSQRGSVSDSGGRNVSLFLIWLQFPVIGTDSGPTRVSLSHQNCPHLSHSRISLFLFFTPRCASSLCSFHRPPPTVVLLK